MYKYIFVKNVIRSWVSRSVSLWTIRPQRSIRWNGKLETRKPRMLNWNRVEKAMRRWGSGLGKAPVSRPSRKKLLQEVDPRNASEPDQIPCRMPQELHEELTPVLTVLFKNSYKTGSLPAVWKSAWVTPVFKKGTKFDASNYRPVSLPCVACKLLEHVLCIHIRNHLDKYNALSSYQHRFRKKLSFESQILMTSHDLLSRLGHKDEVDLGILDFTRAFDIVPHQRLMQKSVCMA